jgi:RND superfamily putative drug exporter
MLAKLAGLIWCRSKQLLVAAAVLAVLGGALSATLFDRLTAGGLTDTGAESGRAAAVLAETGQGAPNLTLLVTTPDGVDDADSARAGSQLTQRLSGEPHVKDVSSYWSAGKSPQLRSEDGKQALVVATIAGDETTVGKRLDALLPRYEGEHDGLEVTAGGYAMFQKESAKLSQEDATKGEMITFPVTLVILVLIFGSIVSALLPLIVAFFAMLVGMGIMWLLASVTDLSVFAMSVVTLLGLGLAIDYCLLMVNRYREELRSASPEEALRTTMVTAGRTVSFSAVTVAVVLAGLLFFPLQAVRSLAYGGMITAMLSAVAALTVLPALFVALGPRVEKGRVLRKRGANSTDGTESGFWHRLAVFVMRRPVPVATLALAFLLLLGAPALGMKLGMPDERSMPGDSQSRQVATAIREGFGSAEVNALQVVAERTPKGNDNVDAYATELSRLPHAGRVDTATGSYVDGERVTPGTEQHQRFSIGDGTYFSVVPSSASADTATELVGEVRSLQAPFETLVGGTAAVNEDTTQSLSDRLPYAGRSRHRDDRAALPAHRKCAPSVARPGTERAESDRHLRCARLDLPGGPLRLAPGRLHRDRHDHLDRSRDALRPVVRPGHGLPGLHARPNPGGVRTHRVRHRRRGHGSGTHRAHGDRGRRTDLDRLPGLPRIGHHVRQGLRRRTAARRAHGRDDHPRCAPAGSHAAGRTGDVVGPRPTAPAARAVRHQRIGGDRRDGPVGRHSQAAPAHVTDQKGLRALPT